MPQSSSRVSRGNVNKNAWGSQRCMRHAGWDSIQGVAQFREYACGCLEVHKSCLAGQGWCRRKWCSQEGILLGAQEVSCRARKCMLENHRSREDHEGCIIGTIWVRESVHGSRKSIRKCTGAQAVMLSSGRCVVSVQTGGMGKKDWHGFLPACLPPVPFLGGKWLLLDGGWSKGLWD